MLQTNCVLHNCLFCDVRFSYYELKYFWHTCLTLHDNFNGNTIYRQKRRKYSARWLKKVAVLAARPR